MVAGFRLGEVAVLHPENSKHPILRECGDWLAGAALETILEQHESFAGVAPSLAGRSESLQRLSLWSPVGEPSRVSDHVTDRDDTGHSLIQIVDELESQMRDDLFDERRSIHGPAVALNASELPVTHDSLNSSLHLC